MKNKGFKVTAIILTLAITFIAHPFLVVKAAAQTLEFNSSGSGTGYRYDRYAWANDGTETESIQVNGNTFKGSEIIQFEVYFAENSTGTFRINKGSRDAMGDYTVYVNNAVIQSKGTSYFTISYTNVNHVTVVLTTYNNNAYTYGQTELPTISNINFTASGTEDIETTLGDIDVLLSGIDTTLNQIVALLGYPGDTPINDQLHIIAQYSAYLDDISLALDDIDNQIDMITYNVSNMTYKGWTETGASYNNAQNSSHSGGYYAFENVNFSAARLNDIFKIILPIRIVPYGYIGPDLIEFYYYSQRAQQFTRIYPDEILYFQTYSYFTMYLTFNITGDGTIQDTNPIFFKINTNKTTYYTKNDYLFFGSISPDDIEYWTLKNAMSQQNLIDILSNISNGSTETQTSTSIDSITSDLNDQIQDSNQAQQSIDNMLEDFNLTFDLDDYKFTFDDNAFNYFKIKLTNIFDINQLKPFYIIPLVLFIVWRLLSG